MPILSNCCFCIDLKFGTKIIGILHLIVGLINSFIFARVTFILAGNGKDDVKSLNGGQLPPDYEDDIMEITNYVGDIMEITKYLISIVSIIVYVIFAVCLLTVINSSMLIHGVRRNRRGLFVPYIFQEFITMIVIASLSIWIIVVFRAQGPIIGTVLGLLTWVIIDIYFVLVVISQYQALGLIRTHEEEMSMK